MMTEQDLPMKNHCHGYLHFSHCKVHSNTVSVEMKKTNIMHQIFYAEVTL